MTESSIVIPIEEDGTKLPEEETKVVPEEGEKIKKQEEEKGKEESSKKEISWSNLSCSMKVPKSPGLSWTTWSTCASDRGKGKRILRNLHGSVEESTLVGILGPSGSGKSTLLECLLGRNCSNRLITGKINHTNVDKSSICFISQQDYLYDQLTIEESIIFAASVKNSPKNPRNSPNSRKSSQKITPSNVSRNRSIVPATVNLLIEPSVSIVSKEPPVPIVSKVSKRKKIDTILDNLWLRRCAKVRVGSCSGGQKKRLSIACELVSNPGFLFLDEPTSGLDSSTCFQCIQLLRRLVNDPGSSTTTLSILLTIHQPSARVLSSFDQIYVLSKDGENLYFGPPGSLVDFLSSISISCPRFHNPSDFIIEIASDEHGTDTLRACINKRNKGIPIGERNRSVEPINRSLFRRSKSQRFDLRRLRILLGRNIKVVFREPLLTWLRFLVHIFVGLVVSFLYGSNVGNAPGCNWNNNFGVAEAIDSKSLVATNENMTLILFTLMFLTFTSMMPTLLIFPRELSVFLKEESNGWYSISTYYMSVTLLDFPFQVILPVFFVGIVYPLTNQISDFSRFLLFTLVCSLTSLVSQSVGMLIATIFASSLNAVVFLAPVSSIPPFLFSGFFVRIPSMPIELKPLTYLSYVKYSFEALVLTIYGLDRCPSRKGSALFLSSDRESVYIGDEKFGGNFLSNRDTNPAINPNDYVTFNTSNRHEMIHDYDIPLDEPLSKSAQYYGWKKEYYSYVLKEFALEDGSEGEIKLTWNLVILFCVFLGLRLITLLLLIRKTRN